MNKIASLFIALSLFWTNPVLSEADQYDLIDRIVEQAPIEEIVPLLFVIGPPGDAGNHLSSKNLNRLLNKYSFGGFILNGYHYWSDSDDPDHVLRKLRSLNNELITRGADKHTNMPPIMAIDYESYEFSSLQNIPMVPHIPSAQSLAATRDVELIRSAGAFSGSVMRQLGFNTLLGPVLDTQNSQDRGYFSSTHTRSFSSDKNVLINTAGNFLYGLKDSGTIVVAKHLPGIGSVNENPHKEVSKRIGVSKIDLAPDVFLEQLGIFKAFKEHYDGVMTSHVVIPPSLKRPDPVTVDTTFVKSFVRGDEVADAQHEFKGISIKDKVVMTDDVSDMGSILRYKLDNDLSWEDLFLRIISSDHDVILISHFSGLPGASRVRYGGSLTVEEFEQSLEGIGQRALVDKSLERTIRQSAARVLKMKYDYYSKFYPDFKVGEQTRLEDFEVGVITASEIESNAEAAIVDSRGVDLIDNLLRASFSKVSGSDYDAAEVFTGDSKICTFVGGSNIQLYRDSLSSWPNVEHNELKESNGDQKKLDAIMKDAIELSRSCDYLFVEVSTKESTDILDAIIWKGNASSTIALLHTSPLSISLGALSSIRIFGSFTKHPRSHSTNLEFIKGDLIPNSTVNLPVQVGDRPVEGVTVNLPDGPYQDLPLHAYPLASAQKSRIRSLTDDISVRDKRIEELELTISQIKEEAVTKGEILAILSDEVGNLVDRAGNVALVDEAFDLQMVVLEKLVADPLVFADIERMTFDGVLDASEIKLVKELVELDHRDYVSAIFSSRMEEKSIFSPYFLAYLLSIVILVSGISIYIYAMRDFNKSNRKKKQLYWLTESPFGVILIIVSATSLMTLYFISPNQENIERIEWAISVYNGLFG